MPGKGGNGGAQQTASRKSKSSSRNKRGDTAVAEAAAAAHRDATRSGGAGGAGAGDGDEESRYDGVVTEQAFRDGLEQLESKRGSSRETGLASAVRFMQDNVSAPVIDELAAAFKRGALGSLKKSRANETVLACKLLSLLAMHIGPDADATAQDLNAALRTVIDKPSMDADARAAAVETLSVVTLVCATEDATTEATMASIEGLIKHTRTPGVVRASALRAWAFMASLYTAREMAAPADRMIAPISAHLQHANVHVRSAAGTCLALIAETRGSAPDEDDAEDGDGKAAEDEGDDYAFGDESDSGGESEEDYDEDEVEDRKKEWNWRTALGDDWLEDADEGPARRTYLLEKLAADTAERLNALRTEGAKHRNRKEKRALRSAFRDVYATVVEDVVPVSVIRIREAVANLYGWGRRIQLNTFRDLLGPGLQQHLEFSELLHAVLDVSGRVARGHKNRAAKAERRAFFSRSAEADRQRTQDREAGRDNKAAANAGFTAQGGSE